MTSRKVAAESWFSIRETHLHNKSSSQTLSASSLASRVESMDSEAIQLKTLSEEQRSLKAMRFRLFPTEKEKEQMLLMMEQWRWYYNFAVDTFYARKSYAKLRDAMREYQYVPHEESQELNCVSLPLSVNQDGKNPVRSVMVAGTDSQGAVKGGDFPVGTVTKHFPSVAGSGDVVAHRIGITREDCV
jgi:hypothetical protein